MSVHLTKANEKLKEVGKEFEFVLKHCEYHQNEVPLETLVLVLLKSTAILGEAVTDLTAATYDLEHVVAIHGDSIEALEDTTLREGEQE